MAEQLKDEWLRIFCVSSMVLLMLDVAANGWSDGWKEGVCNLTTVIILTLASSGSAWIQEIVLS